MVALIAAFTATVVKSSRRSAFSVPSAKETDRDVSPPLLLLPPAMPATRAACLRSAR